MVARRRLRRRSLALVVLVACSAVGMTLMHRQRDDAGHTLARQPASVAPTVPVSKPVAMPADLDLPQPTGWLGAVPTGYPRTLPGAVAAAYGYSRVASGLDVADADRAVATFSDPASGWFDQARQDEVATGVIAQRKALGLAAIGPTGAASVSVTPSSFQVRSAGPYAATVLTLNVVSMTGADGTSSTGLLVYRWPLRWDGTRWLVTSVYVDDADQALAVTPLTAQARMAGWTVAHGG